MQTRSRFPARYGPILTDRCCFGRNRKRAGRDQKVGCNNGAMTTSGDRDFREAAARYHLTNPAWQLSALPSGCPRRSRSHYWDTREMFFG